MKHICISGKMQITAQDMHDDLIPEWRNLRRIPMGYQSILPLKLMKRYRCAVVGSAQGVLTVAITDRLTASLIETLTQLTGYTIFPVRVKPARMSLLIRRLERWERRRGEMLRWPHPLKLVRIHAMMVFVYWTRREN